MQRGYALLSEGLKHKGNGNLNEDGLPRKQPNTVSAARRTWREKQR